MKNILKLEELAMFGLCIWALYFLGAKWWCYPLLLLGPDISMIGYAGGNKMGVFMYNLFHHKGMAVVIFVIGLLLPDRHHFIRTFVDGQDVWIWFKVE